MRLPYLCNEIPYTVRTMALCTEMGSCQDLSLAGHIHQMILETWVHIESFHGLLLDSSQPCPGPMLPNCESDPQEDRYTSIWIPRIAHAGALAINLNSLALKDDATIILKVILIKSNFQTHFMILSASSKTVVRWKSQNPIHGESALVQLMVWSR